MPDVKTYFIADAHNRIKIGRSNDPAARLAALQTGSAHPLRLLAVLDGNFEKELHMKFARFNISGEWFKDCDEIRKFIAESLGEVWVQPFYSWLLDQRALHPYNDDVSKLAFMVATDKHFYKQTNDLDVLLRYYKDTPRWQAAVKTAHRLWRNTQNATKQKAYWSRPERVAERIRRKEALKLALGRLA